MFSRCVLCLAIFAVGQTCYWNDKCTYKFFGSKTVYDDVRGDVRDVEELHGCDPMSVWAIIRHGTRRPSQFNVNSILGATKFRDEIVKKHFEGRGELCAQDIANLRASSWHEVTEATAGHLTVEGYQELYELGDRFHEKYFPLLKELDEYHFRPTLEQRTIESAKAFVEGLVQGNFEFEITNATDVDDVLRPYYYCARHREEVYNGPRSKTEMNNYQNTKEFQTVIENVTNRSGLDGPLSAANVTNLYELCRYFRAYSPKTSPWCALFSEQDLVVIEYLYDIRHYFRNSYGFTTNPKLGRLPLKDLFDNFQRAVQGSNRSFTGYFSHDSTLQMMYSALGLFRDYPEISGFERNPNRKWRTSTLTPFAANFVAVLHKCSNDTTSPNYQVQFLMNEKEFHLCNARTCSWNEFVEKFEPYMDSNLDFCQSDKETTSSPLKNVEVTRN